MTVTAKSDAIIPPEIIEEIDAYIEEFYKKSKTAADEVVRAGLTPSQVRIFEKIVSSTTRFSEIINHIKNQAGKDKTKRWMQVAPILLSQLEELEAKADYMKRRYLISYHFIGQLEAQRMDKASINDLMETALNKYIKQEELLSYCERIIDSETENKSLMSIMEEAKMKPETALRIKMILAKGWARQIVTHYLFKRAISDEFDQLD